MCRSSSGSLGPPQPLPPILFGFHCILELFGISSQQFYIGRSYTKVWVLGFLSERILEDWVILGPHGNTGLVLRSSYCLLHVLSMPAQPLSLFPSMPGPHRHWRPRPWTHISGSPPPDTAGSHSPPWAVSTQDTKGLPQTWVLFLWRRYGSLIRVAT